MGTLPGRQDEGSVMSSAVRLEYDRGTVVVSGGPADLDITSLPGVLYDPRTGAFRAQGRHYRAIVEHLRQGGWAYVDAARGWANAPVGWTLTTPRQPRDYQREAVAQWLASGRRGVIVLPTGTGKTFVAILCIEKVSRPTLVVTPTIDLMNQWSLELSQCFGVTVGMVGGGSHDFQDLTVTTYDSAFQRLEQWANRFGLVIFDECHHLPGPSYSEAAIAALAPFRLGLTATPERADQGEERYPELIGPIVYRVNITDLAGDYLAEYRVERIYVDLTSVEEETYLSCRAQYRRFIEENRISLTGANAWAKFVFEASRTAEGRQALEAYRTYKRIEQGASAKMLVLEELLARHAQERAIIFTADNATVYRISRQFFLPAMTHQTKAKERKQILERLHDGTYNGVVTSQVLNEGVDVPAASVGIVISGTSSTRENVQRLGRLLRKHGQKQAVLYELVARGTMEEFVSDRRRQHQAFEGR